MHVAGALAARGGRGSAGRGAGARPGGGLAGAGSGVPVAPWRALWHGGLGGCLGRGVHNGPSVIVPRSTCRIAGVDV